MRRTLERRRGWDTPLIARQTGQSALGRPPVIGLRALGVENLQVRLWRSFGRKFVTRRSIAVCSVLRGGKRNSAAPVINQHSAVLREIQTLRHAPLPECSNSVHFTGPVSQRSTDPRPHLGIQHKLAATLGQPPLRWVPQGRSPGGNGNRTPRRDAEVAQKAPPARFPCGLAALGAR